MPRARQAEALATQPEEEGALTPLTPLTPQPSFFADALAALAGSASADAGAGGGLPGLAPGLGLSAGLGSVGAATLPPAPSLFSEALAAMASAATPGADTPPALPAQARPLPSCLSYAVRGVAVAELAAAAVLQRVVAARLQSAWPQILHVSACLGTLFTARGTSPFLKSQTLTLCRVLAPACHSAEAMPSLSRNVQKLP